jgi:hypothetical protein
MSPSFQTSRVRASAVSGSTRALAGGGRRGDRLARRLGSNSFIGEAPMNTAGAAVLPGTGRTPRSSQPGKSPFAKGYWYYGLQVVKEMVWPLSFRRLSRVCETARRYIQL